MTRPLLLDLCCKQGGCSVGYWRAGFDVIGVDIDPQPRYPFPFMRADVLDVLLDLVGRRTRLAAIHVSPPCQAYTTGGRVKAREQRPRLIEPVRAALHVIGLPYVIENVPEAPLVDPVQLCGSMFGLGVRRHRLFEVNFPCPRPACSRDMHRAQGPIVGVYGRPHGDAGAWPGMLPGNYSRACELRTPTSRSAA